MSFRKTEFRHNVKTQDELKNKSTKLQIIYLMVKIKNNNLGKIMIT